MQNPFEFKQIQTLHIKSEHNPRVSIKNESMVIEAIIDNVETLITVPVNCLVKNKDSSDAKLSCSNVIGLNAKRSQSPRIRNRLITGVGKKRQGELNGMAKLTEKQVIEIKEIFNDEAYASTFENKGCFYDEIAKAYGVTRACILAIKTNTTWRHLSV